MSNKKEPPKPPHETTKMMHGGYSPEEYHGVVNPPITRASTILYPSLDEFEAPFYKYDYGRNNHPLMDEFLTQMTALENGCGALPAPCGMAAISAALMGFLKTGDHLLMVDNAYGCTPRFCKETLENFGIEITYYDPLIGAGIKDLIQDNTRVIFMESPGSATFEIQDVPAIVKVAQAHNITTMLDNSWAGGVFYKPLDHGVDISIVSCTKYINGHSDGLLGVAIAREEKTYQKLATSFRSIGMSAGSEEINLALRGLRTVHLRLREAQKQAEGVIQFLQTRDEVAKIYSPTLKDHPGHDIWKRDFIGSNALLSILLKPAPKEAFKALIEGFQYFRMGDSWGGYESLCQPQHTIVKRRIAVPFEQEGWLLRLHVGMEDVSDLIADLERSLDAYGESL